METTRISHLLKGDHSGDSFTVSVDYTDEQITIENYYSGNLVVIDFADFDSIVNVVRSIKFQLENINL